jgi:hypothetical protein
MSALGHNLAVPPSARIDDMAGLFTIEVGVGGTLRWGGGGIHDGELQVDGPGRIELPALLDAEGRRRLRINKKYVGDLDVEFFTDYRTRVTATSELTFMARDYKGR